MKRSLPEFADAIIETMSSITREFLRCETNELYKTRVTIPQFIILEILDKHRALKMTELAFMMNTSKAAATKIIDRLADAGYVIRSSDKDDRRVVKVAPTASGMRAVRGAMKNRKEMITKMFDVVSQGEREEYLRILTKIQRHLESEGDKTR